MKKILYLTLLTGLQLYATKHDSELVEKAQKKIKKLQQAMSAVQNNSSNLTDQEKEQKKADIQRQIAFEHLFLSGIQ